MYFPPRSLISVTKPLQCTGVAYSMAPEWARPTTILHWPGKLGHENRNKVDTAIAYDKRTNLPTSWGFLVDKSNDNLDVQTYFKLDLDPTHRKEYQQGLAPEEARRWFIDYLHYIYQAIKSHFDDTYPRWSSQFLEFLFSVPTTWKNPGMIGELQSLIRKAGFGERLNHKVVISLTEAEAAAVYASKQQYQRGEVFLVCDAGGGTTDINILKVANSMFDQTLLEPLSYVEGLAVGSALIDFQMEEQIRKRLESVRPSLHDEPDRLAERMISSGDRFEIFKCSFGSEALQVLDLHIPVPGLPTGRDLPQANIWDSKMVIKKYDNINLSTYDAGLTKLQARLTGCF